MKVKKIDVLFVPLEVEYKRLLLRWVFAFLAWFMLIRFKKFIFTMNGVPVCSIYRLIIPRFVRGGEKNKENEEW